MMNVMNTITICEDLKEGIKLYRMNQSPKEELHI